MPHDADELRSDIATVARAFSRLNYVHAFGHVSRRLDRTLLITPTRPPLGAVRAGDVIELDFEGNVVSGDVGARPIEVFLHIGIYEARADVGAICRTHAHFASTWPPEGKLPAVQHGFGGVVGAVAAYDSTDLIHDAERGRGAARALGNANGLILRGNGVATVGHTLAEAAVRMWSLEERFAQAWRQGVRQAPFSPEELAARARWYQAESERAWTWLKHLGSCDSKTGAAGF